MPFRPSIDAICAYGGGHFWSRGGGHSPPARIFITLLPMKLVFYGDSMTEYLHDSLRAFRGYFAPALPESAVELLNYGVGATRAEMILYRMLHEFWHGRKRMVPLSVLQPDVIILESCAFNNAADRTEGLANFNAIWDQIYDACRIYAPKALTIFYITIPSAPVIPDELANRLFFHSDPAIFSYRFEWRSRYQDQFAAWAAARGIELLDIRCDVVAMEAQGQPRTAWIHADGVHPNAAGVDLISRRLAEEVTRRVGVAGTAK